jgi:signal transduction histidine kinase
VANNLTRRAPPWLVDTSLALLLATAALVDLATFDATEVSAVGISEPEALTVLLILAQTLPLAFRRRFPTMVLVMVSLGFIVDRSLNYPSTVAFFGLAFAFHAVGNELEQRRSLVVGSSGIAILVGFTLSGWLVDEVSFGTVLTMLIFTIFPFLLGRETHERRETESALEVRAARLEREQAEAVQAERARISREIHDVVAHEMTVATVLTSAARRLVGKDDDRAEEALNSAEQAGHDALRELRSLLGVLRTDDDAPTAPQPGLGELPALIEQVHEAGLEVSVQIEGPARTLAATTDLSLYRIIQESLTNTLKHAGPKSRVDVRLTYSADLVAVDIVDDGRGAAQALATQGETGHGLIGMRERTVMLDGEFAAGPRPGGGYRVRARIPYRHP